MVYIVPTSTSSMSSPNASSSTQTDLSFENIIRNTMLTSYFFTIFASVIMNAVVLLAVYLEKDLHNANKYFVACLALSDFMVAVFSVTIRLHQYIKTDVALSIHACRFWIWVDIFTELASITTLTMISIDRYLKVDKPLKYKTMMSTTKCKAVIMFLWIYSAVVAFLGLIPYRGSKGVHINSEGICLNDNKEFYTLAACIGFFIPVVILIIMCTLMFRVVKRFQKSRSIQTQDPSFESPMMPRVHCGGKRLVNSNKRTVAIFSLIVLAFIICWGPFFFLFVIIQYNQRLLSISKKNYQILSVICFNILPYANSFINPVIYAYFDKSFNIAIKNILLRMVGKDRKSLIRLRTGTGLIDTLPRHISNV